MAEIKTKPTKASVAKYLESIKDEKQRRDSKKIVALMEAVTKAKPVMWGPSIIGFGKVKYKYASGKELDWIMMGFAPRKNTISLYMTCNLDQMAPLLANFGKHKRGVGCLYIKTLDDISLPVLKKLLNESKRQAGKIN